MLPTYTPLQPPIFQHFQPKQSLDERFFVNVLNFFVDHQEPVERFHTPNEGVVNPSQQQQQSSGSRLQRHEDQLDDGYNQTSPRDGSRPGIQNMRPQQRKSENAYDQEYVGSSSAARKVMDFFRRRGKGGGVYD